jgi:GTP cyclohydrolase III
VLLLRWGWGTGTKQHRQQQQQQQQRHDISIRIGIGKTQKPAATVRATEAAACIPTSQGIGNGVS